MHNRLLVHILKKYKIKIQLLLVYIFAMLIPIVVIGTLFVVNTRAILSKYYHGLLEADNLRVTSIFTELSTQAYSISTEVVNDKQLGKLTSYQYYIPDNYEKDRQEVTVFEDVSGYPGLKNLCIFSDNKHFYTSDRINLADSEIQSSEWFIKASKLNKTFWCVLDINGLENQICLVRPIINDDSDNRVVLVLSIDREYLKNKIQLENDTINIVLDDGTIIYKTQDGNDSLFVNSKMKISKEISLYGTSTVANVVSFDGEAAFWIETITIIEIAVVLIVLVLSSLLVHVFRELFISRITDLRDAMHQVSNEDYDLSTYELTGNDEVVEAFEDLKVTISSIKAKDAEVYNTVLRQRELDSRQKEMEFEMLASKINPHFLYNTLETIRMKAFTNGDRDVAMAIKLLGKSLRYVLENTGTQYTTLDKELEHVKNYLDIQKLRFGDRFDDEIIIEDGIDTSSIFILPLLLQPVVENSIIHGLDDSESGGLITIRILIIDKNYVIYISDNGKGMEEDDLLRLKENIKIKNVSKKNSIGLYNINQRLSLAYGPEYELEIESKPNEGSTIIIRIPIDKTSEM